MRNLAKGFILFCWLALFSGEAFATNYITSVGTQQVSITIASGSLSNTATITGVGSGAFIIFQGATPSETSAQLDDTSTRVELTNSTTVTATRGVTGSSKTVIANAVILDADTTNLIKSVQNGTISITSGNTSGTATISSVTNNNAATAYLGTTFGGSQTTEANLAIVSLSGTTVTASVNTAPGASGAVVGYSVIEFQGSALNSNVQNIAYSASATGTSDTATISSVTAGNTFLINGGWNVSGSGLLPSKEEMYAKLTNGTTVTFTWSSTNTNLRQFNLSAVELKSGILNQSVQRGTIALAGATSNTATITSSIKGNAFTNWLNNSTIDSTGNPSIDVFRITQTNNTTLTMSAAASSTGTGSYENVEFHAYVSPGGSPAQDVIWFGSAF